MTIDLIPLGAGSALSRDYDNSNLLIRIVTGATTKHFLLDCGITAPKLWKRVHDTVKLDGLILTHTHADHAGGIEEIGYHYKFFFKSKLPLYTNHDVFDLLWSGRLRGGLAFGEKQPEDYFELHLGELPLECGTFFWHRMQHVSKDFPNYGFSCLIDGTLLWFSGDCVFTKEMFEETYWEHRYERAHPDVILHEVSFDSSTKQSHTYYGDLKALPQVWKERMLLYHYDDMREDVAADGFRGYVRAGDAIRLSR